MIIKKKVVKVGHPLTKLSEFAHNLTSVCPEMFFVIADSTETTFCVRHVCAIVLLVLPDRFTRGIVVTNDANLIFQPESEQNNNNFRLNGVRAEQNEMQT